MGIVAAVSSRNAAANMARFSAIDSAIPPIFVHTPPSPPITSPETIDEIRNSRPSEATSANPRSRLSRKSPRSLIGMAHTLSNAFWAACVTPSPAHSEPAIPMTSEIARPWSSWPVISLPMIGNWPSTELLIDRCAPGWPWST